jgi:NADP-dependent 3-hydroxy acid dehydrogenase YdfG
VADLVSHVRRTTSKLDILILNAGVFHPGPFDKVNVLAWDTSCTTLLGTPCAPHKELLANPLRISQFKSMPS